MTEQSQHDSPTPQPRQPAAGASPRYETSDASIKAILYFAVGLALFVFLVCLGLWGMMKMYIYHTLHEDFNLGRQQSPVADHQHPPEPVLQPTIDIHPTKAWQDVQMMNDENRRELASYGWVDARHQVARIPLNDAIDLVIQRGLPAELPATEPSTQPAAPTTALSPTLPPGSPAPSAPPNAPPTVPGGHP